MNQYRTFLHAVITIPDAVLGVESQGFTTIIEEGLSNTHVYVTMLEIVESHVVHQVYASYFDDLIATMVIIYRCKNVIIQVFDKVVNTICSCHSCFLLDLFVSNHTSWFIGNKTSFQVNRQLYLTNLGNVRL